MRDASCMVTNQSMGNSSWMHIDTFFNSSNMQINQFSTTLKLANIKNVFILAKNIDGTTTYPSTIALKSYTNHSMKNFISIMKSNGLKVFFYYPVNTDPSWLSINQQDIAYQIGKIGGKIPIPDPTKKMINLTSEKYKQYLIKLMEEAINLFQIDGIQLDYIRYTNGSIGFSKEEIEKAKQKKIPIDKIIDLTYQTFVNPGDWKTLLTKYDLGDQDVIAWANLREEIVFDFTKRIVDSLSKKKILIGSTLVSSGANKKAYTAIHFGQNWEKMSSILNFVTPMAYHENANDVGKFVEDICLGAILKIAPHCKIGIGIQANSTSTSKMMSAINAVKKHNLDFVLFRIGTFSFAHYDFFPLTKDQFLFKLILGNYTENKSITSLELKNTGNFFTIESLPKNCQLKSRSINNTLISFIIPLSADNSHSIDIRSNWNGAKSQSFFAFTLSSSDSQNEIPTLNIANFSIHQLKINLITLESSFNNEKIPLETFLIDNQKTWISFSSISRIFNFQVELTQKQISLKKNLSRLIINQSEKKGIFSLDNSEFLIDNPHFFSHIGYLPLKELMDLFRITVLVNQTENAVFCSSFARKNRGSSYSLLNQMDPFSLWITDSDEIFIDFDDYLSHSFYKETSTIHLLGRKIHILIDANKHASDECEKIIKLITNQKENLLVPDQFSYKISSNSNWKLIPQYRQAITDDIVLYSKMKEAGYKPIMIIGQDCKPTSLVFDKLYFDMSHQKMEDNVRKDQYNAKIIKNLYRFSNLKF